ncbi:DUF4405 domain-containing protein [Mucisphaera sp.]|uniref:DUF4405 domain-containing protein n=1 Tax=Mucisphaera sp. TaxID=2913024 RepID=UPI003D0A4390
MSRNGVNGLIDLGLAVLMLGLAVTGLGMAYVLPAGTGHSRALLGLTRHDWGSVHLWISYGVLALVGVHLAMHWGWVLVTARRVVWPSAKGMPSAGVRWVTGFGTLLVVVTLVLGLGLWARSAVMAIDGGGGGHGHGHEVGLVEEHEPGGSEGWSRGGRRWRERDQRTR